MRIYLDETPLEDSTALTLQDAIDDIARRSDRLIVLVQADGIEVPNDHLTDPPLDEPYAQELRFTTADPALLVRETLFGASDALNDVRPTQQTVAAMIESGDTGTALGQLGSIVAVWEQVNQAWELSRQVDGTSFTSVADASKTAGMDVEAATQSLNESLKELQRSLVAMDWPGLADVLTYEMDEQADQWSSLLATLARSID